MADYSTKMRGFMRTEITKNVNKVKNSLSSISEDEKVKILARMEKLTIELPTINEVIMRELLTTEEKQEVITAEYERCVEYDENIAFAINKLKNELNPTPVVNRGIDAAALNALSLPTVPLPKYHHKVGEDLNKFFTKFENVISKYGLSSYEKFIFLQRQLFNEPKDIIESLEECKQNYEEAKALLLRAFGSSSSQKFRTIKELSELKQVPTEPYAYISKMRKTAESVSSLKIDMKDVMQYFFWSGMDEKLQKQFIYMTNTNKPSFDQIEKNMFEAADRYLSLKKTSSSSESDGESVGAAAAAVARPRQDSERKKFCSLCTGKGDKVMTHNAYECKKYPNLEDKQSRINSLNGCLRCGNMTHQTDTCRFKFNKRCFFCKNFHFSYLCDEGKKDEKSSNVKEVKQVKSKNKSDKKSNAKENSVQSGSVFIGKVSIGDYGLDSVIPTFTAKTKNNSEIRCMRDSGCQPNMITQTCVKKLKLKTSNDFVLNVNGVNGTSSKNVKIAEVPLDSNPTPIRAICVPEIKMKVNIPGLSDVAKNFRDKGYELADKNLLSSDRIENIDVVLGNLDSHVLMQKDIKFGDPPSVYAETPRGVLLMGSVNRMMQNIDSLPDKLDTEPSSIGVANSTIENVKDDDFVKIDSSVGIDENVLNEALERIMKQSYFENNQYVASTDNDNLADEEVCQFVLDNTTRSEDDRLVMPMLWRGEIAHKLAANKNLSMQVLKSNFKKLSKDPIKLKMYDDVLKEQVEMGVLEEIPDLDEFIKENPSFSFIPHMGVFRMDHQSTKCRIVLLSNLCEQHNNSISHNQAILSGPNLNNKISTSIIKMRFDQFILCFDIKKAFLNIALKPEDQLKFLIMWYKDVRNGNLDIVAFKSTRLPFGLRASPCILMLALFKMLVVDASEDEGDLKAMKKLVYDLSYMDNCCVTTNDKDKLREYYEMLPKVFNSYKFALQQFVSNDVDLQSQIDAKEDQSTEIETKLLGLRYDRVNDTIFTAQLNLDQKADNKRNILSSIAKNFDIFQFSGPLLNRARIFMHDLQCRKGLGWDQKLESELISEWKNIAHQVNSSKPMPIKRFVGQRDSKYDIIAFVDASKLMIGVVIYLKDLSTGNVSFLLARNKIVGTQLEGRTIPSLELFAAAFGVETVLEVYEEFCGSKALVPIKIENLVLYSDSMVSLNWVNNHVNKLAKTQKYSAFVRNKLEVIRKLCSAHPIYFKFISGKSNPADLVTRPISYKQLLKTDYHAGPDFLVTSSACEMDGEMSFLVPNPDAIPENSKSSESTLFHAATSLDRSMEPIEPQPLVQIEKFSTQKKLVNVVNRVAIFLVKTWKKVCKRKNWTRTL